MRAAAACTALALALAGGAQAQAVPGGDSGAGKGEGWRVEGYQLRAGARTGGGARVEGQGIRLLRPEDAGALVVVVDRTVEGPAAHVAQERLDALPIARVEFLPGAEARARWGNAAARGAVVVSTLRRTGRREDPWRDPPEFGDLALAGAPAPAAGLRIQVDGAALPPGMAPDRYPLDAVLVHAPASGNLAMDLVTRTVPPTPVPVPAAPAIPAELRGSPPATERPLVIVDGRVVHAGPEGRAPDVDLESLDIRSVEVVKPHSGAFRAWGDRGRNGVILITT